MQLQGTLPPRCQNIGMQVIRPQKGCWLPRHRSQIGTQPVFQSIHIQGCKTEVRCASVVGLLSLLRTPSAVYPWHKDPDRYTLCVYVCNSGPLHVKCFLKPSLHLHLHKKAPHRCSHTLSTHLPSCLLSWANSMLPCSRHRKH